MSLSIEKIEHYISFWSYQKNIPYRSDDDIVAFVGPTKAGKSTLVNALMKKRLMCCLNEAAGEIFIVKADDDNGPTIGTIGESQSEQPACYENLPGTNLLMWDFAGFGDNRGAIQEIANAIAVRAVLCQQRSVRLALVVPFDMIKQTDPLPFFKLLENLLNISPEIAHFTCLIASKKERGNLKASICKLINCHFRDASVERQTLIAKAKSVLQIIYDNDAFIEFKCPVMAEGVKEEVFRLPNEDTIVKSLNSVIGKNISDCRMVISDQAKFELLELYDVVYMSLRDSINDVATALNDWTDQKIADILAGNGDNSSKRNELRTQINNFRCWSLNTPDLKLLLRNIRVILNNIDTAIGFSKYFNYLEELRNECNLANTHIRGTEEFRLKLVCELNICISLLNNEINNLNPTEVAVVPFDRAAHNETLERYRNLAMENGRNIVQSIWNFYMENRTMIHNIIVGFLALRRGRIGGRW